MTYKITSSGLQKAENAEVMVGHIYYMGASSSPETIVITKVEVDKIWFVRSYEAEWKGKTQPSFQFRAIVEDLISTAGNTLRKQYEQAQTRTGPFAKIEQAGTKFALDTHGSKYTFEKRYVCRYCGDDFDAPINGLSPCCQHEDYKTNQPAI